MYYCIVHTLSKDWNVKSMYGTIHNLINVLVHTYGYNIKNVQETWYDSHKIHIVLLL